MEKTHWKKIVSDPNYLGEADFNEGEEKVATIKEIRRSVTVKTAEGEAQKAVLYFKEAIKPMILNATRSKAIQKVSGSKYVEDWPGTRIILYVDDNVKAFGELVSAVRVRFCKPKEAPPVLCADCGGPVKPANGRSAAYMAEYTKRKFGAVLCYDCAMKRTARKEEPDVTPGTTEEAAPADG